MSGTVVGTVGALYRHLVKSMRGESVETLKLSWYGIEGDRRYAFVKTGNLRRFPWLTARDVPELLTYAPYLVDPADPRSAQVRVRTPDGDDLALDSDALRDALQRRYGQPLHLMQQSRGMPDSASVSVMGLPSICILGQRIGLDLDPRRFRQNIYLETASGEAFGEEAWVGRVLIFGGGDDAARVRINRRDPRCTIVNLDPDRAVQDPAVLAEIAQARDGCAGLYCSVEAPGTIQVGDAVYLD